MKKLLLLLAIIISTASIAQSNDEAVLARVDLLNKTVFGTKDSVTLNGLLASELTYGHSGGKIEDRQEALHNATTNGNVYSELAMKDFKVFYKGKSAIVRYTVSFVQTTNGTPTKLTLGMLQVWVKENKKWKLTARQAVKLTS
jgi:hypothetical protein